MERGNLNISLISWPLLLISLFICTLTANSTQITSDPLEESVFCAMKNICGQGTCVTNSSSLLGFDCDCNPGWKKIQIGSLTFPSCLVPNCTIDFQCGNGAPPPPPPPPSLPPPFNISDPCNLVWCGEGTCVANGTGHICQCYEGSANLFDSTAFACFKPCSLGADCNNLRIGLLPPPPPSSGSTDKGSNAVPNCLRNLQAVTTILLSATFLTWI